MIQLGCNIAFSQSYNSELNTLGQYVQRMYMNEPFEGAKVISDVDKCYLVCLVAESATANEYATQRKAEVKAMRYANEYLNGTQISSNTIVYTKETSDGYYSHGGNLCSALHCRDSLVLPVCDASFLYGVAGIGSKAGWRFLYDCMYFAIPSCYRDEEES